MTTFTGNRTWMDRVRSAFGAQDETMLAAALAEAQTTTTSNAAGAPVINIHTTDKSSTPDQQRDFAVSTADALAKINESVKTLGTRFSDLEGKVKEMGDKATKDAEAAVKDKAAKDEDDAKRAKATKDAEDAKALKDAEDAAAKDKAAKDTAAATPAKTGDSASLATAFQDTLSRAEILIPGISLPTFDAAANAQVTEDGLCAFRRRVLIAAETSGANKPHVVAMKPAGADVATMTCDSVGYVFQAASELAKVSNNKTGPQGTGGSAPRKEPLTPAEINKRNHDYYYPGPKH